MEFLIFFIPLAIWVGIIWGSVQIANSKGRSAVLWGILAAVFGLIPLIIIAVLPPSEPSHY